MLKDSNSSFVIGNWYCLSKALVYWMLDQVQHDELIVKIMAEDIKPAIEVKVECYAGYRADERPRRFAFGQRNIEVDEIIDQW